MARVGLVAVATGIAFASSLARAELPPPDAKTAAELAALAEALFEQGKAKMAEHRYDEACPMLAESQRLDPGGGTLLTLALCHERQGRTATAWIELKEALARAERDGEADRATVARQHVEALEPRLSRLLIHVPAATAKAPGLAVTRDGIALGRPAWDLPAPVDPGEHDVEVSAPGRRSWTARVRVGSGADLVRVEVPPLAPDARPEPAPPAPRGLSSRTIAAISLAGAGAVSLGIGVGFGARAIERQSAANAVCPTTHCNDTSALQANAAARSAAWVADVALPLGAAAGIAAIALFATAPRARTPPKVSWTLTLSAGGASARGTF